MPLVGICAGGIGQPISLPRPRHSRLVAGRIPVGRVLDRTSTGGSYFAHSRSAMRVSCRLHR
jgi:hypothetical protein